MILVRVCPFQKACIRENSTKLHYCGNHLKMLSSHSIFRIWKERKTNHMDFLNNWRNIIALLQSISKSLPFWKEKQEKVYLTKRRKLQQQIKLMAIFLQKPIKFWISQVRNLYKKLHRLRLDYDKAKSASNKL